MRGEKPVLEERGGRDLPGFYLYEVCVIVVDNVMLCFLPVKDARNWGLRKRFGIS